MKDNIEDIYELSPAQQGILFHSLYSPDSGVYFVQQCYTLHGNLNIVAFEDAWQQVVTRHSALRTSFYWENLDKPIQVVNQQVEVPLKQYDWRGIDPALQQEQLEAFLESDRSSGFDLSQESLIRLTLIRLSDDSYQFIWSKHHLILDGWSTALVLKDVVQRYKALCQGQNVPDIPSRPYGDYIVWLQQQDLSKAETFWRQVLSGKQAPTPLISPNVNQPHPAEYDEQQVKLSQTTTAALQSLARQHHLTLSTLVQGVWAILLSRYSREEDVIYGSTVSGRPADLAGAESMVGLFINTLPVRVKVDANTALLPWLEQLQAQLVEMRQYEYSPLVEIQGWSEVPRGVPLFESILVFENYPVDGVLRESKVNIEIQNVSAFDRTNYPLTASAIPGSELEFNISYDRNRFDRATITRMLGHFQTLLEAMVTNPNVLLKDLPLLTKAEEHQLLVEWNDTQADYPQDLCIHQLFEAQVERSPDAVAAVFKHQQLTYRELNNRANQLAHYLQQLGVKPEVLVGICMERSLEMVVGLLGILKAGGAYVPLDPTYPKERLSFMLSDAQVPMLLTQEKLMPGLFEYQGRILCLHTDWGITLAESEENPVSGATSQNLAYVVYTSGSTGKSKGVAIAHRSLVNAYQAWENAYQLQSLTNHLQMASFSFDVFSGDLIRALCSGAKLVLCPREWLLEPEKLYKFMCDEKIDSAEFVPAVLRNLVQYLERTQKNLHFMRLLVVGSDSLYVKEYEEFQRFCGSETRLINSYGVSEATIDSTYFESTKVNLPVEGLVPIGRPFANTQIYILNSHLQPVPVGVPGELHIGGVGLARGYLNRPELTKEKFIFNPFENSKFRVLPISEETFETQHPKIQNSKFNRLYKTGDLVRYLPDGTIEFLGRIDNQVKIRGFRIELGEIEVLLNQHPAVQTSVVVVQQECSRFQRLVAYTVLEPEQGLTVTQMRNFLKPKLPEYMIPSALVVLATLPLTPNGKVDRRSLPAPDPIQLIPDATFVAASTPVEEMLAGIWAQVLGIEKVGIDNNFFELGGHSLLATRVISQLRDVFQVELPLRRLFESPTVAELAKDLETATKAGLGQAPPIERVSRDGNLPLSFAQQRLWFLAQLEPDNPFYNIPTAIGIKGQLNLAALEQSLNEILRRHEVLRTSFQTADGRPVSVISSVTSLLLPTIDLSELPPHEQQTQVRQLATREAQQPFALDTSPLLRVKLLRLGEQEYVVLFTMHHIVSDAWSMGILVREVAALYQAFRTDQLLPLPELPIQYADFAAWQRQWLQGEVLDAQLSYWRQQLSGAPAVLELPTDRPRPAVQTFRGATCGFQLSREVSWALKTLSQQEGSTLFMTLLAALNILLCRYTGSEDIVVGSPIANRRRAELEGLIGFFVNTLVLRTDLSDNPTFRELLHRVREVALGAYAHQDLPFEQLVEALQPERSLSHTPLFQVMFVLQNAPISEIELPGLTLSPVESNSGSAKFDLTLSVQETAEGLIGTFEYNADLFEATTIARMVGHWQTLLCGVVANPDRRLSELPLLTEPERHQLLVEWNDTRIEYGHQNCIHQLFEEQVERTPDAIALVFEDQHLTYQELNVRANQLAHHLRSLGIAPEVLVGICVERSLEMVVGLLGILKAGGAYVPLDPAYPKERLAFMLEDAQVPVLLTQTKLVETLPPHQSQIIYLDANWDAIASNCQENPASGVTTNNRAYAIYTSGSTGQPKGVEILHGALVNFLSAMRLSPGLCQTDILLSVTTLSFDIAALELYLPLIVGAGLVLVSRDVAADGIQLLERLINSGATVMQATPATWRLLLAAGWQGCQHLKILCGGEALDSGLASQLLERGSEVWNLYGPTETTIWSAAHKVEVCKSSDLRFAAALRYRENSIVAIGRPIANTQFYVLDPQGQPVPVGIAGELHIGGVGVARGYLHRPELTAQKFIPNLLLDSRERGTGNREQGKEETGNSLHTSSFTLHPSERLYKTGDLVRYLPDGNLEYLGRIDHQVKIRGFRIELGEIEALLNQHPAVQTSVVVVQQEPAPSQRLVAYAVLEPEQGLTVTQMRNFLKPKLPEYMIPSALVVLATLPLTPNGKVDRRSLPAPDPIQLMPDATFVAASTPVEEMLAGIWAQVLGLEKVGIDNNFFELGGHSLLATRVISQLRDVFQVELPLRRLFESPTVAELAKDIETTAKGDLGLRVPPIERVSRDGNLPLSFAQQRLWFLAQLEPDDPAYNIPVAVRLKGQLDVKALEQSLNEVIKRHESLRTSFITVDGQPFQAIAPTLTLTLPIIDLSDWHPPDREIEARRLVIESALQPFDLTQCGLLRLTLLRLGAEEHIILLTMHHIVSDAWSMGVLVQEIAASYKAFCGDKPGLGDAALTPLPELPIQYADFAVWQREWLQGEVLQTQLNYWKQQLGSTHPRLALPTTRVWSKTVGNREDKRDKGDKEDKKDSPSLPTTDDYTPTTPLHSTIKTNRGARQSFVLSKDLTEAIALISRQEEVTLFMTLLAAFQASLYCFTGTEDIRVGSPIANRNLVEIEGLIGCFVNTLVLRIDLSGNPSFRELLVRSRQVTLEAYTHQDLPFEKLVEELQPERNLSHSPLYQAWFVLQNAPMPSLELPSLTWSPLVIDSGTARHDLLLSISESPEGLKGTFEYRTHLLEKAVIARLVRYLETLLRQVTNQPDTRLIELSEMLAEIDREQQFSQKREIQNAERQKLKMSKRKGIRN